MARRFARAAEGATFELGKFVAASAKLRSDSCSCTRYGADQDILRSVLNRTSTGAATRVRARFLSSLRAPLTQLARIHTEHLRRGGFVVAAGVQDHVHVLLFLARKILGEWRPVLQLA
jgi:hypothetical protein